MQRPDLPKNSQRATLHWVSDAELGITWADGHESVYSLAHLRKACPCARCKAWPSKDDQGFPIWPVERDLHATAVNPVGRYAIQFVWSDGHQTGYYPYDYLRKLCPCAGCQAK
ncbi:MAG: hypothetical protein A2Z21_02080 [Candidatus Fraserbacteria bacterium RBG_16_55_9]|uniref:Gamma-butyrobetaine hydroxylase-like N-terminal domain-containing protein n=1 Tax=Fraserbacteria sp. (strain RBG_16_55_9) TaxID=1817864 RepID=A0A1F5V1B2_FRAXR|nr:MAG: hypothetical protein A2Z21_02080 [Candidatus Fraserbacteria bacterium RBG_16_55_9]